MAFSDWSTTASENTTVGSVFIGENCPPGNLNNMGREIMAQLRAAFSRALGTFYSANTIADARTAIKAVGTEGSDQMTGNLVRQGAGPHLYHATSTFTSGRIFVTASGAADPTSLPGDIWIILS
ncbi:hypothetical protein [Sphingomonas beigongshangi]|uniref:hypothetical protein n=1 Tax=Sphingomonas beigongshangi TaxID=2782540 RepID=UPI00193C0AC3|nr:hypothetical protein [Sphingomonas beigongshangi]